MKLKNYTEDGLLTSKSIDFHPECIFNSIEELNAKAIQLEPLIISEARKIITKIPLNDLIQEGRICVYKTLRRVKNDKSLITFVQTSLKNHFYQLCKCDMRYTPMQNEVVTTFIEDEGYEMQIYDEAEIKDCQKIQQLLDLFPKNYQIIIKKYYGLIGDKRKTLHELGHEYKVTHMNIYYMIRMFKKICKKFLNNNITSQDEKFLKRIHKRYNKKRNLENV